MYPAAIGGSAAEPRRPAWTMLFPSRGTGILRLEVKCDANAVSDLRHAYGQWKKCELNEIDVAYPRTFSATVGFARSASVRKPGLNTIVSLYPRPAKPSSVRPLLL